MIETRGLSKNYGATRALIDLDLEVREGEVLGFLGPNGAGKSTTIRLLLGLLRPSAGTATVLGLDAWRDRVAIHHRVGYLPGDVRLWNHLRGREVLTLLASLRGGARQESERTARKLAARLALDLEKRVRAYSKGNKQKLGIVQALMHTPELLILDEPTSALDPLIQEEVYQVLRELASSGTTVFFSSHVLSEVEKICDRVAIIRKGRLLQLEEVGRLRTFSGRRARVSFQRDAQVSLPRLQGAGLAIEASEGNTVELKLEQGPGPLLQALAQCQDEAGLEVADLIIEPLSLEEVFFEFYRDSEDEVRS